VCAVVAEEASREGEVAGSSLVDHVATQLYTGDWPVGFLP
jgi:hypothetical protein